MRSELEKIKNEALLAIKAARDKLELEALENKFLGRKSGALTSLLKGLKNLAAEIRKDVGMAANDAKQAIEAAVVARYREFNSAAWNKIAEVERLDITQPSLPPLARGHRHPITLVQRELENLFSSMGYLIVDGPEIESDYYNFTALNTPPAHPARDSQDTFYIKGHSADSAKATPHAWVMRAHTSPIQVRVPQKYGVPVRAISPGKCFRNEATDVRHEHTFYQLDGVVIDKGITFAHLKGTLEVVAKHLYGQDTEVRLRPKYYPFVEPGVNGEVTCFLCQAKGCRLCKGSGWLEIFGAGPMHPNVLREAGVDPNVYSGFAFGFGLTRLVMLKYGIEDIRLLESGNMKFLEQF